MSTRKQRHAGNKERGWEELNAAIGLTGMMESEAWYIADELSHNEDVACEVLVGHFGSLEIAQRSFDTLSDDIAERYQAVRDVLRKKVGR